VWNPHGFQFINVLDKGRKFSAMHHLAEILSPLSEWRAFDARESDRKLIVHADDAQSHTPKLSVGFFDENRMKMVLHPPYSLDIAPSDFYLFVHVKGYLASRSFLDAEELFEVF
jgi:hypothetical protein